MTLLNDIILAMYELGGIANYESLYEKISQNKGILRQNLVEPSIRARIEEYSSDSSAYLGRNDIFYSVQGLGHGLWGLRSIKSHRASDLSDFLPPMFGDIPGINEDDILDNRQELFDTGLHRNLFGGIAGQKDNGTQSILLSDGYEDDIDNGDVIYYTGRGGRNLETGSQEKNQTLEENLSLVKNKESGKPIRVIRSYKLNSPYAPQNGYLYSGLYYVKDYWLEKGKSGFDIIRFLLVNNNYFINSTRKDKYLDDKSSQPNRASQLIQRIVRNTQLGQEIKELYQFRCQICGEKLKIGSGWYAEASHIQPLGKPHNGPDAKSNILCLCPNHHVLLDYGMITINNDYSLNGFSGNLFRDTDHYINLEFIEYHRVHIGLLK